MSTYHKGDRIALDCTNDPFTHLKRGDKGTVSYVSQNESRIGVKWDNGSTLTMIPDEGDQISVISKES